LLLAMAGCSTLNELIYLTPSEALQHFLICI
jgi:hypothetical protein